MGLTLPSLQTKTFHHTLDDSRGVESAERTSGLDVGSTLPQGAWTYDEGQVMCQTKKQLAGAKKM